MKELKNKGFITREDGQFIVGVQDREVHDERYVVSPLTDSEALTVSEYIEEKIFESNKKDSDKKRVFVSIPMNGRDDKEVKEERAMLVERCAPGYELIDQMVGSETTRIDMLGRSIRLMSKADLVIFADGWEESPGCKVERLVCIEYNIPNVDVTYKF